MSNEKEIAEQLVERFKVVADISRQSAIKCALICTKESIEVMSMAGGETARLYILYANKVVNELEKL